MSLWSSNRLEQTCPAPSVTMDSHPGTLQTNSPQLINFCLAPLTRHLECTSVCADDYSATNLISRDPHLRQKGFRVEHFIRPPVHLNFYFLAPVSIAHVLVQPDLMEGTEARVSIFTSSATTPVPQQRQQQQMVLCGRGAVTAEKNVLVLRNKSFEGKHKGLDAACVLGSHISPNDLIQRSEQPLKQMNNVRLLKLSITQFSGPRPVALKLVEVWGTLGSCCTREEMMGARRATASLRMPTNLVNDVSVYNSNPEHGRRVTVAGQLCQPWEIHPTESGQAVSACVHSGDRKVCNTSMERSEGEGLTPDMTTLPASIAESLQAVRTCTHIRESAHDGTQRPVTLHVQRANRVSSIFPSTYFLGNQQSPCPCGEQPEVNGGPQPIPRVSEASQCSASLSCQDSADWSCKGSHEPSAERYCFKTPCTSTVSASDFGGLAMMQPCKDVNRTGQARDEEGTVRIPEHFLDEITCELMVLPMLLPSGHFVDRSTLEKLHHTDITYGRPPSDPFTGIELTDIHQHSYFMCSCTSTVLVIVL